MVATIFSSLALLSSSVSKANLSICSYHLLQSCLSFFVRLHGQTEPFGRAASFSSLALLSSVCMANLKCLLVTTSPVFVFSPTTLHFNLLRVARHCFSWSSVSDDHFFSSCNFWLSLLTYLIRSYPQPFFPLSLKLCLL